MTGKNSKSKKSKSSAKKGGHQQAATHVTLQKENVPDSSQLLTMEKCKHLQHKILPKLHFHHW